MQCTYSGVLEIIIITGSACDVTTTVKMPRGYMANAIMAHAAAEKRKRYRLMEKNLKQQQAEAQKLEDLFETCPFGRRQFNSRWLIPV